MQTEQRIAIAEFCGWRDISDSTNWLTKPDGSRQFLGIENDWRNFAPDYLNDLNAIHGAIQTLVTEINQWEYFLQLELIVCGNLEHIPLEEWEKTRGFKIINATAAQRCEALLKTITKPPENPPEEIP